MYVHHHAAQKLPMVVMAAVIMALADARVVIVAAAGIVVVAVVVARRHAQLMDALLVRLVRNHAQLVRNRMECAHIQALAQIVTCRLSKQQYNNCGMCHNNNSY